MKSPLLCTHKGEFSFPVAIYCRQFWLPKIPTVWNSTRTFATFYYVHVLHQGYVSFYVCGHVHARCLQPFSLLWIPFFYKWFASKSHLWIPLRLTSRNFRNIRIYHFTQSSSSGSVREKIYFFKLSSQAEINLSLYRVLYILRSHEAKRKTSKKRSPLTSSTCVILMHCTATEQTDNFYSQTEIFQWYLGN